MSEVDGEVLTLLDESVRSFLAQRHGRRRLAEPGRDTAALWPEMADLGLLGLSLAEEDGGSGLGAAAVLGVARRLGEQLAPEPFVACAIIPGVLISALPPGALRDDLASSLLAAADRLTLAWQEAPGQIGAWPAACTIDAEGRLHGAKLFVPAAQERAFVTAVCAGEPAIALVDLTGDRACLQRRPSSSGPDYAEIRFSGAPVLGGAPVLAGSQAASAVAQALDLGALALSAQLTGLIDGVVGLTLEHLKTRIQFGRPIGSFQALQHRAVDMRIGLALAEASVEEARRLFDRAPGASASRAAVSAAKARSSSVALAVCKEAFQMHGAMGFTEEADVGIYARAALHWSSWLGGAREHRRRFVDLGGEMIHAS